MDQVEDSNRIWGLEAGRGQGQDRLWGLVERGQVQDLN